MYPLAVARMPDSSEEMELLDLIGTFQIFEMPAQPKSALVQSPMTSGLGSKFSTLFHWSLPKGWYS